MQGFVVPKELGFKQHSRSLDVKNFPNCLARGLYLMENSCGMNIGPYRNFVSGEYRIPIDGISKIFYKTILINRMRKIN